MAGSAASAAELCKHAANDEKCNRLGWVCIPLTVETYGCWGEEAGRCLDRLATRIATRTGCPKSSAVSGLYGRLSLNLVRANARVLLARSASFVGYIYGKCPAKSGLWGYNFITIKIARSTIQHSFATVLCFPFKFRTLVPCTSFLCAKIDFCDLHLFHAVDTTIVNPAG